MYNYVIPKNITNTPCYRNSNNLDSRNGLLLPLLFGAAVGFPLGFIASNTKNQGYGYQPYPQPYYPQYPVYQQPYPIVNPMPMY